MEGEATKVPDWLMPHLAASHVHNLNIWAWQGPACFAVLQLAMPGFAICKEPERLRLLCCEAHRFVFGGGQPLIEKAVKPGIDCPVIDKPVAKVTIARLGARQ